MEYLWKVGETEYPLKLTTRKTIELEDKLGYTPLMIFGIDGDTIPSLKDMLTVIGCALPPTAPDVCNLIDRWIEDGHQQMELFQIIPEIYWASGIMKKEPDEKPKNQKARTKA